MIRMLVTGSRVWPDPATVYRMLAAEWRELSGDRGDLLPLTVVHGACPTGADSHADAWARAQRAAGLPVTIEPVPADWARYGKPAGPLRNQQMVNRGADVCVAFPMPNTRTDGKPTGTEDCMDRAQRAGIPVRTAGVRA